MTAKEFSEEFDILLNQRIKDKPAEIDEYNKSQMLTKANEEVALKYSLQFEQSEFARRVLNSLVGTLKTSTIDYNSSSFISLDGTLKSAVIDAPNDLMMIVHEQAKYDENVLTISPIRHDEYNNIKDNPFRTPNYKKAWRLDFNDTSNKIEVIYSSNIPDTLEYSCRYVRLPKPIILPDATLAWDDSNMEIREELTEQTSELNSIVHEEVLNTAVNLFIQNTNN